MKTKHLLLPTFCLFASMIIAEETTDTPKRDYTMVNFNSDLTCKLLEIGTTSLTFSVEWSSNIDTPRKLEFVGKLIPETRGWSALHALDTNLADRERIERLWGGSWDSRFPKEIDLAQRKAIFEVQYRVIPWNRWKNEREKFAQKAIFTVGPGISSEEEWDSIYGGYDEKKEDPPPTIATAEAGVQGGEKTSSSQGKLAKQDGVVVEQEKSENKSNPNRLWLYAGILILICVGFYVLRRKLKTGN